MLWHFPSQISKYYYGLVDLHYPNNASTFEVKWQYVLPSNIACLNVRMKLKHQDLAWTVLKVLHVKRFYQKSLGLLCTVLHAWHDLINCTGLVISTFGAWNRTSKFFEMSEIWICQKSGFSAVQISALA